MMNITHISVSIIEKGLLTRPLSSRMHNIKAHVSQDTASYSMNSSVLSSIQPVDYYFIRENTKTIIEIFWIMQLTFPFVLLKATEDTDANFVSLSIYPPSLSISATCIVCTWSKRLVYMTALPPVAYTYGNEYSQVTR
jgi:hypothetical protein